MRLYTSTTETERFATYKNQIATEDILLSHDYQVII